MLVVADFISLDWVHRPEYGPGWFEKEIDDEVYQLHYDFKTGMIIVWNEKIEKIFSSAVKEVYVFPTDTELKRCRNEIVKKYSSQIFETEDGERRVREKSTTVDFNYEK